MRVVIDTNCLLASIPQDSEHHWLYTAFQMGRFEWFVSNEIMREYEEMTSHIYSPTAAHFVLSRLDSSANVFYAEPYFNWQLIEQDPDDNKFADLAIAAQADYLVTNDRHFNVLKQYDYLPLQCVTISQFKEVLNWPMRSTAGV
jgi:putative PIN family toxin of toxin-antitoxin system